MSVIKPDGLPNNKENYRPKIDDPAIIQKISAMAWKEKITFKKAFNRWLRWAEERYDREYGVILESIFLPSQPHAKEIMAQIEKQNSQEEQEPT